MHCCNFCRCVKQLVSLTLLVLVMAALPPVTAAQQERIIFDTDMGNDIDDALTLAMLHALDCRGEADLLAVTITKDNPWSAPYVDLVNTFYGRGDLPIGVVRNGRTPGDNAMTRAPAVRRNSSGQMVYPRDVKVNEEASPALDVLRRALATEDDGAVTIVQVGFSTNLAQLLESPADRYSDLSGKELVQKKVRRLIVMAGAYPNGDPEYNVYTDVPAAQTLFAEWPTPVVASGYEIGEQLLYPAESIEKEYDYVANHPVAEAYRHYMEMPYDRPTWDLTAVLQAVRPEYGYFDLSETGEIAVNEDGRTSFTPSEEGRHRYLKMKPGEQGRVLEVMRLLASQPPCSGVR